MGFRLDPLLIGLLALFFFVRPTLAFGAGNIAGISKIEGQNWRHGDLEDTLLKIAMARAVGGKKFDKMMVSRVYFGNWLRDYSQAIDVGTVKSVSAEAIRLLLCVLGFLTFGYGSREFEVTADRLGCYRPEDHIDNPKSYADNQDARQYDRRLRGPIDEEVELAVDPDTGMKNYIANENIDIMTSAKHVRKLFKKCIRLGRSYQSTEDKDELYEALRLLGTGLHCLEDFFAHSNYVELALIEMGERDVFPHVGSNTKLRIEGVRQRVYPLVTGTFGGVDFLHSVTGEVSDKLTQSEIENLEGTLQQSQNGDTSLLRDLLDKIPDGFLGDDQKSKVDDIQQDASSSQLENMTVSPRDPEEFTLYIQQIFKQIMPAIQYHDELLQSISAAIEKIPILPKIVEQLEEQLSLFVFQIIAPFIIPVIEQIKNELATGATEVIESSKNEQHIVFHDDDSTDPTHSMLSKDHFSNVLNEIAGRSAAEVVAWVVPQIMEAWDDHDMDVDAMLNKVIYGVLHHPAQREMGEDGASEGREIIFRCVEGWWESMPDEAKDEFRQKLSRDGVLNGDNHKEGVEDCGHGCGKPLGMHKIFGDGEKTMEDRIAAAAADAIIGGVHGRISDMVQGQTGYKIPDRPQREESSGGFGGFLSGLVGSRFSKDNTESYESSSRTEDGGYSRTTGEYGRQGNTYAEAEYTETRYGDGEERREYRREERYEGNESYGGGGGASQSYFRREEESGGDGGYRRQEESYGGGDGGYRRQEESYGGGGASDSYFRRNDDESGGYGGDGYRRRDEGEEGGYGRRWGDDNDEERRRW